MELGDDEHRTLVSSSLHQQSLYAIHIIPYDTMQLALH